MTLVIPASVECIGTEAFYNCPNLKEVAFAEEGNLKVIGINCFAGSGLSEVQTPPSLREIENGAFYDCCNLRFAWLNEGLTVLGNENNHFGGYQDYRLNGVFQASGVEEVLLPRTL